MPSSTIEGTYRENAMTLNTSRRHVIATYGPDKYLVSLAVTTSVDQVVAAADATDAIVQGFKVSFPSAAAPAAPGQPVPGGPARADGPADHAAADPPTARSPRIRACPPGEAWRPGDAQHGTAHDGLVFCGPCSSPPCSACARRS